MLEVFRDGLIMTEGKAREVLSRYLFTGETVFKKVENLSGGEKSRLYLAKLMQTGIYTPEAAGQGTEESKTGDGKINFLILDEPTNHLDIISRENLENALEQFEGTILTVSHDRYFLNKIATRIVEMSEGGVCSHEGDYESYRREKAKKAAAEEGTPPGRAAVKRTAGQDKRSSAKEPAEHMDGKNAFRQNRLELEIENLEDKKRRCEAAMINAGTDYEKLMKLEAEKAMLEKQIEEKIEEWM